MSGSEGLELGSSSSIGSGGAVSDQDQPNSRDVYENGKSSADLDVEDGFNKIQEEAVATWEFGKSIGLRCDVDERETINKIVEMELGDEKRLGGHRATV